MIPAIISTMANAKKMLNVNALIARAMVVPIAVPRAVAALGFMVFSMPSILQRA